MSDAPTRGIPRAREVLDKIENYARNTAESPTAVISTQALHATAIATVELASVSQLSALVALTRSPEYEAAFTGDERIHIVNTIRALLGLNPLEDGHDVA